MMGFVGPSAPFLEGGEEGEGGEELVATGAGEFFPLAGDEEVFEGTVFQVVVDEDFVEGGEGVAVVFEREEVDGLVGGTEAFFSGFFVVEGYLVVLGGSFRGLALSPFFVAELEEEASDGGGEGGPFGDFVFEEMFGDVGEGVVEGDGVLVAVVGGGAGEYGLRDTNDLGGGVSSEVGSLFPEWAHCVKSLPHFCSFVKRFFYISLKCFISSGWYSSVRG